MDGLPSTKLLSSSWFPLGDMSFDPNGRIVPTPWGNMRTGTSHLFCMENITICNF